MSNLKNTFYNDGGIKGAKKIRVSYIYPEKFSQPLSGIDKKILNQAETFNRAGMDCMVLERPADDGVMAKVKFRLPFTNDSRKWEDIDLPPSDVFYIRRVTIASRGLIRLLARIKEETNAIIIWEIPTYPYDEELKRWTTYPLLLKDRMYRKKLYKYVDRIADLAKHDEIFKIPTLQISNGVSLERVARRRASKTSKDIHIAFVAIVCWWHGIDRFIEGMRAYKHSQTDRSVILHIVGDGKPSIMRRLKELVESYNLANNVIFHGLCDDRRVDEVYDECSFAIESLGIHRKGLTVSSSLKSREYLAKGIPFVYSGEIDVFNDDPVDFCLQVPADDSPIDIAKLVRFHDSLYESESEECLIGRIRKYAEDHVGMDKAMENVIDYIKENCGNENR